MTEDLILLNKHLWFYAENPSVQLRTCSGNLMFQADLTLHFKENFEKE